MNRTRYKLWNFRFTYSLDNGYGIQKEKRNYETLCSRSVYEITQEVF